MVLCLWRRRNAICNAIHSFVNSYWRALDLYVVAFWRISKTSLFPFRVQWCNGDACLIAFDLCHLGRDIFFVWTIGRIESIPKRGGWPANPSSVFAIGASREYYG